MDDAAVELLEDTILKKLKDLNKADFNSAKRKNFDTIAQERFDLSKVSKRYFTTIMDNSYKFTNFHIMDKYSRSITKDDIVTFFEDNFVSNDNLKFTVYVRNLFFLNFFLKIFF
jgi:secreted Zn-dependent insulinase-like peptidase